MNKTKFLILSLLAVVALSFGAIAIFNLVVGDKLYFNQTEQMRPRAELEIALTLHILEAENKAIQVITRRSSEFSEFINSRKSGVQPFSIEIVSWTGKWRAIKPHLPFTKSESHEEFIREMFSQHIFTTEDFNAAIKRAIDSSLKDFESIENELAVALREEVIGLPLSSIEAQAAEAEFKEIVEKMIDASQWDATKAAGNLIVSEVAAQVVSQVMARLSRSLGVFAVSSANYWWTFGASFVIGVIVDSVWTWIDDPAGDIELKMLAALDQLSIKASIVLNEELSKEIFRRSALWEMTLARILP